MTFEDIQKANSGLKTTDVKGKNYVEVNQRIKAFRQLYPEGFIRTTILSNENGVCVMRAEVGYVLAMVDNKNGHLETVDVVLGVGTAYEKETSSYINKTSFIENCETSAVGRALGMIGLGIDTSVASAEEVKNAIEQQESKADENKAKIVAQGKADLPISKAEETKLRKLIEAKQANDPVDVRIQKICKSYGVEELADLKKSQFIHLCGALSK